MLLGSDITVSVSSCFSLFIAWQMCVLPEKLRWQFCVEPYQSVCRFIISPALDSETASACRLSGIPPAAERLEGY